MLDLMAARRPYGTGSIFEVGGNYVGKWRVDGRQVKRKLRPIREPGSKDGLTKAMAEARLRALMAQVVPTVTERITVAEAGSLMLVHLEAIGRKRSTIRSYRSNYARQIVPRLGAVPVAGLRLEDVKRFVAACSRDLSPTSTRHCLALLSSICDFAIRQGWAHENPCRRVDRPGRARRTEIRFLAPEEAEALLRACADDDFGRVYRVLFMAAVYTGMRSGELLALRWMDVDWAAQRVRVQRNYIRGEFGTPKTRRGSRSVPLADRLGGELDRHHRQTVFQADEDLVFANPHTGRPLNGHAVLKAFQRALERAGVPKVRFHDCRHTFGTRMAAVGVPMRTLQEWMGHKDFATTLIYADYAPSAGEVGLVNAAFSEKLVPDLVPARIRAVSVQSPGPLR